MIRYVINRTELEAAIELEKPGWLAAAQQKTAQFRAAQGFDEPENKHTWSDIKAVYIKLQQRKCAYCERKLGGLQFGKGEHDVEHYRPKKSVKAWPTAKQKQLDPQRFSYSFSVGAAAEKGYYLLAYNFLNYCTACKSCNSSLKLDYFPMLAATRKHTTDDFTELKREKPLLIYPLSDLDENPETLITFHGLLPVPRFKTGEKYRRARVTIDFFALDTREDLLQIRAEIITKMWLAFDTLQQPNLTAVTRAKAEKILQRATSAKSDQTACARAYLQLCQNDALTALKINDLAEQYLDNN